MNLTLHIGHLKTGSTAIQSHFDSNRRTYMRSCGWLYPVAGKPIPAKPNHGALALQELFEAGGMVSKWYRRSKPFKRYRDGDVRPARLRVAAEIEKKRPENVLLSSELFIKFGADDGVPVEAAKSMLKLFGASHVQIVCLLRRPDRYLESFYNQIVKLGNSPRRLADNVDNFIDTIHVRYDTAVSYWAERVGADQVTLLRYDEVAPNLIEATVTAMGVPIAAELEPELSSARSEVVNPRFPNGLVEFMRVYNKGRSRKHAQALRRSLWRLPELYPEIAETPVYFLDLPARRRLLEVFAPIDARLARLSGAGDRFFPDLEEMAIVSPDAISDEESFRRWSPLALEAVREKLQATVRVPAGK